MIANVQKKNEEIKKLVQSLEEKLEEVSSLESYHDIYRVPRELYKLKPDAYTPQSVSIGPVHHNKEHLKAMETQKLRYLKRFLNRSGKTLDFYVKAVSDLEEEARKCYSDIKSFGRDEFVKMIMMDSCFIFELMEIMKSMEEENNFISNEAWTIEITTDLIKLENQLPLFVLKHLHGLLFDDHPRQGEQPSPLPPPPLPLHHHIYVHLIKPYAVVFNGPILSSAEEIESLLLAEGGAKHFLDFLRCILIPSSSSSKGMRKHGGGGGGGVDQEENLRLTYNASELKTAGVKFQNSPAKKTSLFDIEFDMRKGVLRIPTITIWDDTEPLLRNLIAIEQYQPYTSRYFTAYAAFMDDLIDTAGDVELLVRKGIIANRVGSVETVVNLFNNITKHVIVGCPYFSGVIKELGDYHDKSWNKWMANLRQNYFHTPWAVISVVAAVFLIILTVIQTICSILQVKQF
ncbi:UPF0481 protein At3g47200-like [Telopea speciosissima]|uniref:UPF0481 protein At3g47200-like n=1 Tax=Telopea speciosissima TaxID=54955 RepID=UPI001CC76FA4|nr:UPF0481 protein At3g47200-like [Telopea speciosissima]